MAAGPVTDYQFKQPWIAVVLCWTKKFIENDEENLSNMLTLYDINTHNKILTASATRFSGFVDGLESLLFTHTAESGNVLRQPDHVKLLLLCKTLCEYKTKASQNNKVIVQRLIDIYSDRCFHATIYAGYCLGKNCF